MAKKKAHSLKDRSKQYQRDVYLLPRELWNIVKSYQLNWLEKWRRDMRQVLLDINFTIQCLKTGKCGRFVDCDDAIIFNKSSDVFSCSWTSVLLPQNNVRIWYYWRGEAKDLKQYPFIWLHEQEGEYFTCHCCILEEEIQRRSPMQGGRQNLES